MDPANHEIALDRWRALCPSLRAMCLRDGACLYRQGEQCDDVYVIATGYIKLSRLGVDGTVSTLVVLPAGDLCGACLASRSPADSRDTATAKGPSELYRIRRREFLSAMARDASLAAGVVAKLAARQSFLAARIEQLLDGDVRRRVTALLVDFAGAYGGNCVHGHEIDIRLTQQELAEMTGASRPTVSTVLNRLRDRRLVSYTRRYICIDDLDKLRALANGADIAR